MHAVNYKKKIRKKKSFLHPLKSLKKRVESGIGSGSGAEFVSIRQRYADLDPQQNVTDPPTLENTVYSKHCLNFKTIWGV